MKANHRVCLSGAILIAEASPRTKKKKNRILSSHYVRINCANLRKYSKMNIGNVWRRLKDVIIWTIKNLDFQEFHIEETGILGKKGSS